MNLRNKQVMQGDVSKLCLLVATLVLGSVSGQAGGLCERGHSWWDRQRSVCIPCSRCDPAHRLAVKFPCELHRDTICQSLYEIHIYPFNTPKRVYNETKDTNPSENSDYDYYEYVNYDGEVSDTDDKSDEVSWGLQASTLALAASGCVVFFVVVVTLSVYHTKQWKVLKQALKSDVKDLSAKLRLMEAGGEPPSEPVVSTDHHLYCNIHVGKDALLAMSADTAILCCLKRIMTPGRDCRRSGPVRSWSFNETPFVFAAASWTILIFPGFAGFFTSK